MAKNKMLQLNNIRKDHSLPINLKMKLLECLVWPVMFYGCETWTQKKEDNKHIEAAEMWFYRRLLRTSDYAASARQNSRFATVPLNI